MNLKLLICFILYATTAFSAPKQRLRRGRRKAAGSSKIPYAALSAGIIPSRVRSRLRTRRPSSESGASRSGSERPVKTHSDGSSGGYSSGIQRPQQYGYQTNSGYARNGQYDYQQQYGEQSGGRQAVPVGTSTFPYDTKGIYSGPSQSQYSSQQLPVPSTYRGGQAGYGMQNAYQTPVQQQYAAQQPLYPQQQQLGGAGYARGYSPQGSPYGNVYGGASYGGYARSPQMSYSYGSYGQQPTPYGGAGYNTYGAAAIGSPYRDPYSLYSSYVHPKTEVGNRLTNPYGASDSHYGASQYSGSDGGSSYYGNYQSASVPSSGALGTSGYGQGQQGAYGQSQESQYPYVASNSNQHVSDASSSFGMGSQAKYDDATYGQGNQYGSDAANSFGMGSQSRYDDAAYGQGKQYGGSYGSSMQSPIPDVQSPNYPDYSGVRRTGSGISASPQKPYDSASSMQPAQGYSDPRIATDSRIQTSTRNMHGSMSSDYSGGSSSYSRSYQAGQDDSSRNVESHGSPSRYFNPPQTQAITPPATVRGANGYQRAQWNRPDDVTPVFQNPNGGRMVSHSRTRFQDEQSGTRLKPTRISHIVMLTSGVPVHEQSTVKTASVSQTTVATSLPRSQVQRDGLPDLAIHPADLKKDGSVFLDTRSKSEIPCAVNENCLSKVHSRTPRRLLLRFPTIVHNIGTADFFPDLPPQDWTYHTCHKHYHSMQEFAHFFLYSDNGTLVGEGHKVSFCLQDSGCKYPSDAKYNCTGASPHHRPTQAISPGCYDDYKASLDCQWIDITGIPTNNKEYTLKIIVNPLIDGERAVAELSYMNNAVSCKITIQSTASLVVGRCQQV